METGLIIYFVALAILAGVFFMLSRIFFKVKSNNKEDREGQAMVTIIFFIAFVICMAIIADTGYDLAFPETTAMPIWLQEYWS